MFVIPPIGRIVRKAAFLTQVISTMLVFLVLLIFSILSWQNAQQTLQAQREQAVNDRLSTISDSISQRMELNRTLLRAGAGLYETTDGNVSQDQWHRFVKQFSVPERFKGVRAVGYIPLVSRDERDNFINAVQKEAPDYKIYPEGDRELYAPVLYRESFRSPNIATGYDAYTSPERRIAMDQARDEGQAAITNVLKISQDTSGVIMYLPVYSPHADPKTVEERRQSIRGFTYMGIATNDFLQNLVGKKDKNIGFMVSEKTGNTTRQIYTTSSQDAHLKPVSTTNAQVFGQTWHVTLLADGGVVPTSDDNRPSTILAGGLAISLITSIAVYLLIQFRTRSFALAEEHRLQQAKDELLSLASHQLRTPATGVKQYIGMVLDGFAGKTPKRQKELLEQAYKSNERQLQIINEFLYVAKIGSGSLTTTVHKFDVAPLVRDIVDEMKSDIEEKQHTIRVKVPKKLLIKADEHSVRMIIENMISNAVKYTRGKGRIVVELKRAGGEAQIIVEDNGIGIAKKDMQLLFKQFSRIPNEMSSEVSGSGIGLYLAQQLAARNGGIITLESETGKGSTFVLHLPLKTVRNITKTSEKT